VIDDAKSVLSLIPAELLHRIGPRLVRDNQTILASLDAALGRSQYGYTPRGGLHGAVSRPMQVSRARSSAATTKRHSASNGSTKSSNGSASARPNKSGRRMQFDITRGAAAGRPRCPNPKPVPGDIQNDRVNLHVEGFPLCDSSSRPTLWHFDAGSGHRPPKQEQTLALQ
jgi:hypothetical protein